MIPYGLATLFYGLLLDKLGRQRIMLISSGTFILLTASTAASWSANAFIISRLLTGLGASGVIPLGLALVGDLFPYERRGRPLGYLFSAVVGGMAFGSTFGIIFETFIGWRMLFVSITIVTKTAMILLFFYRIPESNTEHSTESLCRVFASYRDLLSRGVV
ncbi:MFS transporter [Chthonomonas sp.]|uniref:MFS transporter n=1 Tax=Chthonomonas sp. TaxID=2282153 RepID=UPI0031B801A9